SEIKITVIDIPTGIHEQEEEEQLKDMVLYPVPFDSRVILKFSSVKTGSVNVRIFNETGKEVLSLSKTVTMGEQLIDLDTDRLPSGIYFITLQTDKQIVKRKIIKINSN
ncbi:MAG TPA: T9SS type A sorting domain-containing protein, partial [Bacteroidia bacterium]|nr:T9SS type A sorting domain-containing protein [Bacteroidia bacterium]